MENITDRLKTAIHEIIGGVASEILMGRLDSAIDEAGGDKGSLPKACAKVEKIVNLFIGVDEAKVIGKRCREILDSEGIKTDAA